MSKYDNSMPMAHEAVMSWQAGEIARLKALLAMAGRNGLELLNEIDRLHQVCRDAYEVWAGSEGIPEPETAAEAYVYQLLIQMRDEVKKGL